MLTIGFILVIIVIIFWCSIGGFFCGQVNVLCNSKIIKPDKYMYVFCIVLTPYILVHRIGVYLNVKKEERKIDLESNKRSTRPFVGKDDRSGYGDL